MPPAHDREGDVADALAPASARNQAYQGGHQRGAQHGGQQGRSVARAGLDQQLGLNAQNAAADQGADIKRQEVVGLHENVNDFLSCDRHDSGIDQQRAAENDHNGAAAEVVLDQRQAVADIFQQKTEHHDRGKTAHHALGQHVQVHGRHDHHGQTQKNGPAHSFYVHIHYPHEIPLA